MNHSRERPPVIISVDLDESLIYGPMELSEGVTIVASTMVKSVARSIFQVIRYADLRSLSLYTETH